MIKQILILAFIVTAFSINLKAQSKSEKHYFRGEYVETLALLNEKITDGKATVQDYQMAANCHLQLFDFEKAIECFRLGLKTNPASPELIEGLSDALLNIGFKEEALAGYLQLVFSDSTNTRMQGKMAGVLLDLNRYTEAKNSYQTLYTADSSNIYFMRRLMQTRYKLQDYAYVVDLSLENPYYPNTNKELQMMVADSYSKLDQNKLALGVLDSILDLDSLYQPAINKIAYIQFASYRNYEDAVVYYRLLNRLEKPTDPFHLRNLAICEYFVGNQEYAASVLDSLIREIENDPFVPFYAGLSYQKLGNVDKAFELLKMAADQVIPGYAADFYHHLGRAYASKRMFENAITTYLKVREFAPENYQVLFDIAVTYEEWNLNRTVALTFYQQFVKECPNQHSSDLKYAENRIKLIKEELFFDGK